MKSVMALVVLGLMASSLYVVGNDLAPESATAETATAEQIAQWVSELGDSRFATRRDATDALVTVGQPAVEPVVAAALEGSAEVAVRCVQILRRLKDSTDPAASEAAVAGLRMLAESDNSLVNERALAALDEGSVNPFPQAQLGGIQIQVQGAVFAANNFDVTTTVNNGVRTVEVNDNGKEIDIRDQDGEDIEITITETVNGEETTTEYSAENLDDLKQNHPDIAELYEKYTQQNPFQVQVFGGQLQQMRQIQLPAQAFPAFPAPFGPVPAENEAHQEVASELGSAVERLAAASARLEELLASDEHDEETLAEVIEELNAIQAELAETQDQLND